MSKRNTALFGASLLAALTAIAADHATSEAPSPSSVQQEEYTPCAAAVPTTPAQRNYDDLADDYSGATPAAPKPAPAPAPSNAENPCSAGSL